MSISVFVVDDEPLARNGLVALFQKDTDFEVVGSAGSVAEAVAGIKAHHPQLVMLDVQMADGTGFDVIEKVGPTRMPTVVFVTAYNEFAADAFEVDAVDYLLKPFDDDRFERTIQRAKRAVAAPYPDRIIVKANGRVIFLRTDEIDWIEAADYYVRIHAGKEKHLLREAMASLEKRLDPARFFRVHRGAIVNLDRVRELQPYFRGEYIIVLRDGTKLKMSRGRKEQLETKLK